MKYLFNYFALACLLTLSASLTGCVKFKQTTTVMPDGSGKIHLSVGMSDQMLAMAQQQGENPFDEMSPLKLDEDSKGIVAVTKPEVNEHNIGLLILRGSYRLVGALDDVYQAAQFFK